MADPNPNFVDWRAAFDAVVGLLTFVGGWLMSLIFKRIEKLEQSSDRQMQETHQIRVDLPTQYVPKTEFRELADNIFDALRRIEDKLDNKADK